ncbi:MAG: type II toxin-antitoxin system HigB family toxin [Alphaproteobacteria bacterium]|nr:MAG: type II toxin-antitoxin system HigB family toxin [Alphaproteobacteria bacterium]
MRIIARRILTDFSQNHADAKGALETWWLIAKKADWATPQDVKNQFPRASILADNRVVFDICGGNYRLIVKFNYEYRIGYVRFVGKHADYDAIDATRV